MVTLKSRMRPAAIAAAFTSSALVAAALAFAAAAPGAADTTLNPKTCEAAELAGTIFAEWDPGDGVDNTSAVDYDLYGDGTLLDITGVNGDFELTGVVVKGAEDFTVYTSNFIGMHAPEKNGSLPEISHWFACGEDTPPTSEPPTSEPPTSEPPTSEPPTSEPPTSEPPTSEPPTSEPPTSEPPTSEPPTTEPPTSEPPTSEPPTTEPPTTTTTEPPTSTTTAPPTTTTTTTTTPPLSQTGFNGGPLIPLGALLVLSGIALMAVTRIRRAPGR